VIFHRDRSARWRTRARWRSARIGEQIGTDRNLYFIIRPLLRGRTVYVTLAWRIHPGCLPARLRALAMRKRCGDGGARLEISGKVHFDSRNLEHPLEA